MLTFSAIEEFSKAHEHAIAALGAVGTVLAAFATVAAVAVSLYLARRSETVRLRVVLGIGLSTEAPSSQYVTLRIDNMGVRGAALQPQFFEWRIPFRRRQQPETLFNVVNSAYLINNPTPDIGLTVTNITVVEKDDFFRHFSRQLPLIGCKLRWFRKARLRRLGAVIYINGERQFTVKFARAIADEISSTIQAYLRETGA
jgi:hypothetical protein